MEDLNKLIGKAIINAGTWVRNNRGDLGEHTGGDLRDVANHVSGLGEFYETHGRLPADWEEYRKS